MKRTMMVATFALCATGACEKSKGTNEEAPIQKGSTPKPLPPPPPKPVDAAVPEIAPTAPVPDPHAGHGHDAPATPPGASAPMPPPAAVGGAGDTVRAPVEADLVDYLKNVRGKGTLRAVIDTSLGSFHCALYEKETPMTVANFVGLATGAKAWVNPNTGATMKNTPFFNGLIFHRVIPGFMIQGGDPLGQGVGDAGYKFADEIAPGLKMDAPGILAMANSGPGTNGSQFFITEAAATWLTGKHTIFGKCDEAALVKKITGVPRGPDDKPTTPVTITKVSILRK